jgi:hypothetical protein
MRNKFRGADDVNQWLFRYWQLVKGRFIPENITRDRTLLDFDTDLTGTIKAITSQQYSEIVLNDQIIPQDTVSMIMDALEKAFSTILPTKSEYEL